MVLTAWCASGQHYKIATALAQISTHPDMTLDVARMQTPTTNQLPSLVDAGLLSTLQSE